MAGMTQEEHDGKLSLNVEYRTFQQMYSTLHDAIQAGLSDVVSEVFTKGLISPHTKSVADNASLGDPARASALLNALLQRTKTCAKTFTLFGEVLNSIASFEYLADDMKSNQSILEKKDEEKEREFQKQAKIQEEKRQELQLHISKADSTIELTAGYSYPDSYCSPAVTADVRKIGIPCSQTPVIVDQRAPMSFQHRRTPSSGASSLMSVTITPDSTKPELGLVSKRKPMSTINGVAQKSPTPTCRWHPATDMPAPSQSAPFETCDKPSESNDQQLSSSAPSKIPISELCVATNNTPPVYSNPPLSHKTFLDEQEKMTVLNAPTTVVQAPSPINSEPPRSPPPTDSEKTDELREAVHKLKVNFPQRTPSIDSSGSTCSHDMPSLTSWINESDSEDDPEPRDQLEHATQELDGSTEQAPLPATIKMHRSLSCEKCLKKALRKKMKEIEKKHQEALLEEARAKAALESNNNKLLNEAKTLQNDVYELQCALQQRDLDQQQLQRHSDDLMVVLKQRDDQISQLKDELKEVKADAYDMHTAAKKEKLRSHRCPSCNIEFTYNGV